MSLEPRPSLRPAAPSGPAHQEPTWLWPRQPIRETPLRPYGPVPRPGTPRQTPPVPGGLRTRPVVSPIAAGVAWIATLPALNNPFTMWAIFAIPTASMLTLLAACRWWRWSHSPTSIIMIVLAVAIMTLAMLYLAFIGLSIMVLRSISK